MQTPYLSPSTQGRPLITFIVTYYNFPTQWLNECLDSILSLPLPEEQREIIVIDDGSDNSPLEDLKDKLDAITFIRQPNSGLSVARNFGIEACRGEYIQFVDGDDKLNVLEYSRCLDIASKHKPDIVVFRQSDKEPTRQSDAEGNNTQMEFEGPVDGATYMRHNNLRASACGYLFKKQTLVNLRFTPGILHEDEEFTPQLFLRAEQIYTTKAKAYYYREREQSITHNGDKEWVMQRLADTRGVLFRLAEMKDSLPTAEREAMQRRIDQLTMDYLYNVIKLTRSGKYLEQCVAELTEKELFPLPDKDYTQKYKWFRRISSNRQGRRLLCMILS